MKTILNIPPVDRAAARSTFARSKMKFILASLLVAVAIPSLRAADITWDGGFFGTNSTWLTATNWNPDVIPTNTDNVIFDAAGTATTITIQMANAGGRQRVGSITMGAGGFAPRTIRNNSTASNGVLEVDGLGGTLLANYSGVELTLLNASGSSLPMGLCLGSSGEIFLQYDGAASQLTISSPISETNVSQGFTKTGPGRLLLSGTNNSFTGPVSINAGEIGLNADATFGTGVAPVYLNGGYIQCTADRSGGAPITSPMIMSTDAIIVNRAGTSGTSRTIPFSGPFSGSAGTLTIANLTAVTGNTFLLRLLGGYTFDRPIVIGSGVDTVGSFSILQLYNSATNGVLTLSGDISGQGSIRRQGSTASPGGTAVLTGNNTYSGGTLLTYGSLLANARLVLRSGRVPSRLRTREFSGAMALSARRRRSCWAARFRPDRSRPTWAT